MYVIIYGNPFDGMSTIGPFDDPDEAAQYVELWREIRNDTWWIVEVEPLFEDRQLPAHLDP